MLAGHPARIRRGAVGVWPRDVRQPCEGQSRHVGDVQPGELHRQRLAPETLAMTERALAAHHVLRHALLDQRALGRGERVKHIPLGARESAVVVGGLTPLDRPLDLITVIARIDRNDRLLVGEQQPVAILLRKVAPGPVDVETQSRHDVAQVLALPRQWPGGDGPLANGERVVGHHRALCDFVHASEPVTGGTCALRRVRRERLCLQMRLVCRIGAGTRVQHPDEIGQRGDAADG